MSRHEAWSDEIRQIKHILESVEHATEGLRVLDQWLWGNVVGHDVLPCEMPEPARSSLERLRQELASMRRAGQELFSRFSSGPVAELLDGHRLTREEYYLLAAADIWEMIPWGTAKQLGLSPCDDFEVFSFFWYQDNMRFGYINPEEVQRDPGSQRVRARFGRPPEEIRLSALRPDQREFFERYLPAIYARFTRA